MYDTHYATQASGKELKKYVRDNIVPEQKLDQSPANDIEKALKVFGRGF